MKLIRLSICAVGALALVWQTSGLCPAAETASVRDIVDRCIGRYRSTETLLLRCTYTERAVADPALQFQKLRCMPIGLVPKGTTSTAVYHRDGRTYLDYEDPWYDAWDSTRRHLSTTHPESESDWAAVFDLPYEDVVAAARIALKESPISQYRSIFDGTRLWEAHSEEKLYLHGDNRAVYAVRNTSELASRHFSPTLLDYLLYSFPVPGLPKDHKARQNSFLPYLLDLHDADAKLPSVQYRGESCYSITGENKSTYILSPTYDFSVVSGTLRTNNGAVMATFDVEELNDLGDGVWIPKTVSYRRIGIPDEGGGGGIFVGETLAETLIKVTHAERNLPEHLAYFSVKVPSGSIVADETLVDQAAFNAVPGIRPSVSYVMPADAADLDRVVRAAQRRFAESTIDENRILGTWKQWLVIGNVIVATALLGWMWYRRRHVGNS